MIRRMFNVALLLVALPLAAGSLPGSRSWQVALAAHAGIDSAAIARRLAAMYRGDLETPVDAQGTFLIELADAAAALLAADPNVQSVQVEGAEAVSSAPPVSTPAVVATGSTSWSLGDYSYDGTGNIRKIGTDAYVYDSNARLVSGTAGGKTEQYTYDEFGNILTITTSGSPMRRLGVDPDSNRMDQTTGIVGGESVTYDMTAGYDAAGNVTSHLLDRFQYDGLNVLRKAYVASKWRSYVYNASDERIAVIERSSEFGSETRSDWTLRDASGQVLRRLSREGGQWQWNQDYIYRGGKMLASEVAGPAKRYHYHLDHLGTPRLITGIGGVEISRHTYLPFGTEVGAIAGQNPQDGEWKKFTGHERDQGSMDYMHARYYNPFMGRFLSVDPNAFWELQLGSDEDRAKFRSYLRHPQRWNRYSYVSNNPINKIDPDGREENFYMEQLFREQQMVGEGQMSEEQYWARRRSEGYGAMMGTVGAGGSLLGARLVTAGVTAFQTWRAVSAAAVTIKAIEQASRGDARIFQSAMNFARGTANTFVNNLTALSRAVEQVVGPQGRITQIGTINGQAVWGSARTGFGIVQMNGTTKIVQILADDKYRVIGNFR